MDLFSTELLLKRGGEEVNPLYHWIVRTFGHYGLMWFTFIISLIFYFIWEISKEHRIARELLILMVLFNFIVSFYNIALSFI